MSDWAYWSACSTSCGTGVQTRIRECVFENRNFTSNVGDTGCTDGFQNGYYEEQKCNTLPCRMFSRNCSLKKIFKIDFSFVDEMDELVILSEIMQQQRATNKNKRLHFRWKKS